MQEADKIAAKSIDVETMKFKLSSLPANVLKVVNELDKKEEINYDTNGGTTRKSQRVSQKIQRKTP